LEQIEGFSTVLAFQIMDVKKFNYLDWESIFAFLKVVAGPSKQLQPTQKKLLGIFRRLDLNADTKLTFPEFAEAIKPTEFMPTTFNQEEGISVQEKNRKMQEIKAK